MLKVVGHRVLIKPDPVEERTGSGIWIHTPETAKLEEAAQVRGTVVAIGPTAWHAFDRYNPDGTRNTSWVEWCKVGDKVYYAKYSVKRITDTETGEEYVIANDQDIVAIDIPEKQEDK